MPARFVDFSGAQIPVMQGWDPIVVRKAAIEAEIERLAEQPRPENGIRAARIAHPMSSAPGFGMAPGIDITLNVLMPGEVTTPIRHNSSQVSLCIRGSGQAEIGSQSFAFERRDVWNTPAMHPYQYRNDGTDLLVRLTYSNATLLEQLRTHYIETVPGSWLDAGTASERDRPVKRAKELPAPIKIGSDGAELRTYEHLIAPEIAENKALLWPWKVVREHRDQVFPLNALHNKGRRGLFVLYNPASGRTMGATHSFFATLGFMPPDVLDFPHRHSSNAINYAIEGGFISDVNGTRLSWDEGDIAYTAPGWSAHANGSEEKGGIALTIQDHPFQISTECLIWQEGDGKPIRLLGSQHGFESDDTIQLSKAS